MEENHKEETPKETPLMVFAEKNYNAIKKAEAYSILIFAIGFICYVLKVPKTDFILITGAILTATTFYLQGYKVYEYEDLESFNGLGSVIFINFFYKLYFFSLSVCAIAMLGFVIKFPFWKMMSFWGGITLIAVFILTFFSKIKDKSRVYDLKFYVRLLVCVGLLIYLAYVKGIVK